MRGKSACKEGSLSEQRANKARERKSSPAALSDGALLAIAAAAQVSDEYQAALKSHIRKLVEIIISRKNSRPTIDLKRGRAAIRRVVAPGLKLLHRFKELRLDESARVILEDSMIGLQLARWSDLLKSERQRLAELGYDEEKWDRFTDGLINTLGNADRAAAKFKGETAIVAYYGRVIAELLVCAILAAQRFKADHDFRCHWKPDTGPPNDIAALCPDIDTRCKRTQRTCLCLSWIGFPRAAGACSEKSIPL
jgi:hypothetical protein